jgi:hypothetical protein
LTQRNSRSADRTTWRIAIPIAITGMLQLDCGGAQQQSDLPPCEATLKDILGKDDVEICDPSRLSLFEIQVTKWRSDCATQAENPPVAQRVTSKLQAAADCVEKKRQQEMVKNDCDNRLKEVSEGLTCLGEECTPLLDDLKTIEEKCETPDLKGAFAEKIDHLKAQIEERTKEVDRLRSLSKLIMLCDGFVELEGERQAREAFNQIVNQVSSTSALNETPEADTEVGRFRSGALESCRQPLLLAAEMITQAQAKKLSDKKVKKSNQRWNRHLRLVTTMHRRLHDVNGAQLFPEAMAPLENTIRTYDPAGERYKIPDTGQPGKPEKATTKSETEEGRPATRKQGDESKAGAPARQPPA